MWGQHQGRPTRVQTNKSRKRVSLVVGGIIETKPTPKSKFRNPNPKIPRYRIRNQNSKIQTPKSKIQTPRSRIKTPKSKPQNSESKIKTYINFWFMTAPPKKWTHIFLQIISAVSNISEWKSPKKIWQLIFSLKIHESRKMNEKKSREAPLGPRP